MAVWAEGDGEDVALVTTERRAELFERAHVPEPDPSALAAGGQRVLVRAKDDADDGVRVTAERSAELWVVGVHFPEPYGAVATRRGEGAPIGAEGELVDGVCVALQRFAALLACAHVPERYRPV